MIYEWRYLMRGLTKHSVDVNHRAVSAQCGVGVWAFDGWMGTGTQDEYDMIEQLPACKRCVKIGPVPEESK